MAAVSPSYDSEQYNQRWRNAWDEGLQPGQAWDRSKASPAFTSLLDLGSLDVSGKRALVPGCGRGYDVLELARRGSTATGLELVPSAVEAANAFINGSNLGEQAKNATVIEGDFFTYADPQGPFDVGYDYTFLCALHPDMRSKWAETWAKLLRPGGQLITLMFPIDPLRDPSQGPPWPLTVELYSQLLTAQGFKQVSLDPVPEHQSAADRRGAEVLGRWHKL
ncbi:hypothetical protein WJX72_000782 [[Myrmecia] bisecta]|uniref:S-adenosyl-L-methionine-dependent methyltransferase n=1 Tax=[Myrmecia] bisecta TaxID=41462 RepID=A0AAW1Q5X9_9CHLO